MPNTARSQGESPLGIAGRENVVNWAAIQPV